MVSRGAEGVRPSPARSRAWSLAVVVASAFTWLVASGSTSRRPHGAGPSATRAVSTGAVAIPAPPSASPAVGEPVLPPGPNPPSGHGCSFPDPGDGVRHPFRRLDGGRIAIPRAPALTGDGRFDLLVHFHASEAARRVLAPSAPGVPLVGVDAGARSGSYAEAYRDPGALRRLVRGAEEAMRDKVGRDVRVARVALSAWSAGYGAISEILRSFAPSVDVVILLDALHAAHEGPTRRPGEEQLRPFVELARQASEGGPLLVLTHSSILTHDYASTMEVADFLLERLGRRRVATTSAARPPLRSKFHERNLHVRGYYGEGPDDHCDHLGLLREVMEDHVVPRWSGAP